MDQQLSCPHCRQIMAVTAASTAQQAQCPYCQGLFLVAAADAGQAALPMVETLRSPPATRPAAKEPAKKAPSGLPPEYVKYVIAAAILLNMMLLPLLGYSVVRWLSPRTTAPQTVADTSPASAAPVVVSGTVVGNETAPAAPGPVGGAARPPFTNTPAPAVGPPVNTTASPTFDPPVQAPPVQTPPAGPGRPAATLSAEVTGATPTDTTALIQAIEPSVVVVQVTLEKGSGIGSGFPLDDQGTIVTNYHVIEGAKSARIKFGKKTVEVEGFLVFSPGKDIALLKAKLGGEKVAPLKLATATPSKGENVLTFGAPQGFDSTVSDGIVSSLRNGAELREIFKNMTGADAYVDHLHYDLDALWVQTTAPISGGNSGGPLVNLRGEVVGLNTWGLTRGQNMNFAISANHIKQMMVSTSGVHPLAELPPPREQRVAADNSSRTLEYWEQVSRINRGLINRLKAIRQPPIPKTKAQLMALFPKLAGIYKKLGELLPETAAKLKALKIDDVDGELVALVTVDALLLEKIGEAARDMSLSAKNLDMDRVVLYDCEKLGKKAYGEFEKLEIGQAYDVLRIRLTGRYGETFASLLDAGGRPKKSAKAAEGNADDAGEESAAAGAAKREKEASGKLKIAKSLKSAGKNGAAKERLRQIIDDYQGTKAAEEAQKLLDLPD